jgi:hypothetical protein
MMVTTGGRAGLGGAFTGALRRRGERGCFGCLAGFLFGLAAGFGLFALARFLDLALLLGAQTVLRSLFLLEVLGTGGLFGLALVENLLARFQLVDGDAELRCEGDQLGLHRRGGVSSGVRRLRRAGGAANRDRTAFLGFNDHLLGAAVAETLLYRAGGFPHDGQRFAATGIVLIVFVAHSSYISHSEPGRPCSPADSVIGPVLGTSRVQGPGESR